jgi:hypothetical protein
MIWPFKRRPKLEPDIDAFHRALINSTMGRAHDGRDIAGDFRSLFNENPHLGQRVLFVMLSWCGEYDDPPAETEALQRWAGKREIAGKLKAAMYADLSATEPVAKETGDNVRELGRR